MNAYKAELARLNNESRSREDYWQNQVKVRESQINELSKINQDNADKRRENESKLSNLLADNSRLDADKRKLENDYKNAMEESKNLRADKVNVEAGLSSKLKDAMENLTKIQKEKKDADLASGTKINQLNSSVTTLDAKYKKLEADFKNAVEDRKKLQDSKTKFEADAKTKLTAAQEQVEQLQKEKMEAEANANAQITELQAAIAMTKSEIVNKESEVEILQSRISEAEQSRKKIEEDMLAERTALSTRLEQEKKILDEKIVEIAQKLNQSNIVVNNLVTEQEKQDASMNSVELGNMMTIDLLKTEIKELKDKLKQLIILSKQKAIDKQNAESAMTLKMNNEKQEFLEILSKNREMERKHLHAIDDMKTRLQAAVDQQKRIALASQAMAAQYKEKLQKAAQVIQRIKAEYAQTLAANRKAELTNFFIIDSLKTKLTETLERNKTLINGMVKLAAVVKKQEEAILAMPPPPEEEAEIIQPEAQAFDELPPEDQESEFIEEEYEEEIQDPSQGWQIYSLADFSNSQQPDYPQAIWQNPTKISQQSPISSPAPPRTQPMIRIEQNPNRGLGPVEQPPYRRPDPAPIPVAPVPQRQRALSPGRLDKPGTQQHPRKRPEVRSVQMPRREEVTPVEDRRGRQRGNRSVLPPQTLDNPQPRMTQPRPTAPTSPPVAQGPQPRPAPPTNPPATQRPQTRPSAAPSPQVAQRPQVAPAQPRPTATTNPPVVQRPQVVTAQPRPAAAPNLPVPQHPQSRPVAAPNPPVVQRPQVVTAQLRPVAAVNPQVAQRPRVVTAQPRTVASQSPQVAQSPQSRPVAAPRPQVAQRPQVAPAQSRPVAAENPQVAQRTAQNPPTNHQVGNNSPNQTVAPGAISGSRAGDGPTLAAVHRAERTETPQDQAVDFAIESLLNAVTLLTDGDKNQANSMMNLIGSGKELPKKLAAVIEVLKEQFGPQIFEQTMKEISERFKRRLAFTNESLRYLFGEQGDRLLYW